MQELQLAELLVAGGAFTGGAIGRSQDSQNRTNNEQYPRSKKNSKRKPFWRLRVGINVFNKETVHC